MYSLLTLFLLVPVYFSHVFAPFGWTIGDGSSFERQKLYLAGVLLIFALIEVLVTHRDRYCTVLKKYWKILVAFVILPLLTLHLFDLDKILFFVGSAEKNHGYIWYVGCILLVTLLSSLTATQTRKIILASITGAVIVAGFAIIEWMLGGSPFFSSLLKAPWGEHRSVSTLGNPNYVAGYLLAHLPLLAYISNTKKSYILPLLLGLGIVTTGSYIGIFLMCSYATIYSLGRFLSVRTTIITFGNFLLFGGLGVLIYISADNFLSLEDHGTLSIGQLGEIFSANNDKFPSLKSRGILMFEVGKAFLSSPIGILIGYAPESIIAYFGGTRSLVIDAYFPPTSAIDSSHNIFLDFLFQYGLILFTLGSILAKKSWDVIPYPEKSAIILLLLFLSLNVPITLHIMVLLLLFNARKG